MTTTPERSFDLFWKAYPGKKGGGKDYLRKKWKKQKLDSKAKHIMAVLEAFKKTEQWTRDNGKYIPMLSTFLNQQRWDCDIEDVTDKRAKKCHPLAKGIAKNNNVTYGPHAKRAQEMMAADAPYERTRKFLDVQKRTGNAKLTIWRAYIWLAKHE